MTNYNFLGKARLLTPLSIGLVVVSILLVAFLGLRAGVDFTGGSQFTVIYPEGAEVEAEDIRSYLSRYEDQGVLQAEVHVQATSFEREGVLLPGKIVTLRIDPERHEELVRRIRQELADPPADAGLPAAFRAEGEEGVSFTGVGPQVSGELINRAWQAILIALGALLVYISWRFRLRYAVGAIAALVHDVTIALGLFALFQVEISLPVIAGFLTVVGYSLNDTIVIYDRVRENLMGMKKVPIADVINRSANQSLSRSINTSLSTLIPVVILYAFGGPALQPFAFALLIGVIVGTYSSFFVANPVLWRWAIAAAQMKRKAKASAR
ncbi:MAG: protein translocase subunit SecF [Candidatus Bipolaricaulota bacterium]